MSRNDAPSARLRHACHPRREHAAGRPPGRQLGAHLPVGDLRGRGRRGAGRHPLRPAPRLRVRALGQPHRGGHGGCVRGAARRARPAFAFASGMAAIHAALLSQLRAGDRVVSTQARLRQHPDAADVRARPLRGGGRVRRRDRCRRRRGGPPDAHPGAVSRDHRQSHHRGRRPGRPGRAGPPAWRRGHRRQHVRLAVPVPAPRAGRGPRRRVHHQVGGRSLGRARGRGGRPRGAAWPRSARRRSRRAA